QHGRRRERPRGRQHAAPPQRIRASRAGAKRCNIARVCAAQKNFAAAVISGGVVRLFGSSNPCCGEI
ncbi:hypothetical protein, partial [Burkholderia vietnamiensis]|uniref:hypothetical protein n=1 Tax=Burkholderia vietnamiensis TaxID=60552 RepID=UPI002DD4484F